MNSPEKYNEVMPQTTDRVLCIAVDKPVSVEGYEENFLPRIKKMIEKTGEIRLLIWWRHYKGWELGAAIDDLEATARFGSKVKKMAYVNAPEKLIEKVSIQKSLYAGQIHFYESDALDEALDWVNS